MLWNPLRRTKEDVSPPCTECSHLQHLLDGRVNAGLGDGFRSRSLRSFCHLTLATSSPFAHPALQLKAPHSWRLSQLETLHGRWATINFKMVSLFTVFFASWRAFRDYYME